MVPDIESFVGRISGTSRFPQYLMTAILTGPSAETSRESVVVVVAEERSDRCVWEGEREESDSVVAYRWPHGYDVTKKMI
jgi:hypothetical protein